MQPATPPGQGRPESVIRDEAIGGATMRRVLHHLAWPVRWLRIGRGSLKRGTDRVEMAFRAAVLVAFLAAVPVGLVVGSAMQRQQVAVAAQQARERHPVQAVILADPALPSDTTADTAPAAVSWSDHGKERTATTDVPVTARAGTAVTLWVSSDGRVTTPPLDPGTALGPAIWVGALAGLGVPFVAWCALGLACGILAVRRSRQWEADWQAVEPLWTSRER